MASGKLKVGVVVFPGSNCDQDCYDAAAQQMNAEAVYLWHKESSLQGVDVLMLPGGFSYGDYLRAGAIARFSPIMNSVKEFAAEGKPVIGICNGFQVLTEVGLLPGTLLRNTSLRFVCKRDVALTVENTNTLFTQGYSDKQTIHLPVAHADGNYYAPPNTIEQLEANQQVVFRYVSDINGSTNRIAGICNEGRNVLGMMPHPERNLWTSMDGSWSGDGAALFNAIVSSFLQQVA
jgi:phosphoribosylformylglycinamidine synthase subunit PurQ / glutaminase